MTTFTFYVAIVHGEPFLIGEKAVQSFAWFVNPPIGLRILRIQDDVPPRDVTEDVLAGVVV